MAGNAPAEEIELRGLTVQEISFKTDSVPLEYIHENLVTDTKTSLPLMASSVINHGMSKSFLSEIRELTRQFFVLPFEEKRKYARPINDFEGYGNDVFKNRNLDWVDRLYLLAYPENRRRLQFWPQQPEMFGPLLSTFAVKSQAMIELVFKAMALSLNLENSFWDQYGETGSMFARFNFYPRCPRPDLTLGIKEHTDGSAITILVQDQHVEGLQVLKDDQWFKVPIIPDALFINIGDQMEMMSNGLFRSPVHRVVTNSDKDRVSVVMFATPELDNEIGPVNQLISKDRPQLYKKVKNYPEVFYHHYQLGEQALSAMKL